MNCPYCKDSELEEDSGYSETENCIFATYNCPYCKTEFSGVIFPQIKETTPEGME